MTSYIVQGLYRNLKNKQLYSVIGSGRNVNNPDEILVFYSQLYKSVLGESIDRRSTETIKERHKWARPLDDFEKKFEKENEF
jgi:hypothetical protein